MKAGLDQFFKNCSDKLALLLVFCQHNDRGFILCREGICESVLPRISLTWGGKKHPRAHLTRRAEMVNISLYLCDSTVLAACQLKLLLLRFPSLPFVRRICWKAAAILCFLTPCIFILRRWVADEPTPSLNMLGSNETTAVTKWCSPRVLWQALEDQCLMAELRCLELKKPVTWISILIPENTLKHNRLCCLITQCVFSSSRAWYTWIENNTTVMLWDGRLLWAIGKLRCFEPRERGSWVGRVIWEIKRVGQWLYSAKNLKKKKKSAHKLDNYNN